MTCGTTGKALRWTLGAPAPAASLALLLVLIAAGCSDHPDGGATQPAAPRVAPGPPDRVALIRDQHLPNVELTTHEGRKVRFYDDLVKGKVVAINFMFATCRKAGPAVVNEAPYEESEASKRLVEPADLSRLPLRD